VNGGKGQNRRRIINRTRDNSGKYRLAWFGGENKRKKRGGERSPEWSVNIGGEML